MQNISFMSANFVARQLGYDMPGGWGQGDQAANEWFSPLNTFEERFDEMLTEVKTLGFQAIDIWTGHLNWTWATPAHIAAARRQLQKHGLRVTSYAGGFGATTEEFEAACLVAEGLGSPLLSGGLPLLERDAAAVIAGLRRHGLVFALENHPEKSAEEMLRKIEGLESDLVGVALDTGWFGTAEADVPAQLRRLLPRLKHVHLKDVLPKGAAATGYPFKDMGHETCELGTGKVPVEACLQALIAAGYRGDLSIEHEPEDADPREACARSLEKVRTWMRESITAITPPDPVGVAIVGCGNVAGAYARQIKGYPHVKLLGAQDIDETRAVELTRQYGGKVYTSLEELLADEAVEIVVNLSIHHVHVEIIRQCLEAGKHVHTEKPLALDSKSAWELVRLAADRNLRLSSAPTTWLGEAQLKAWKKVREGAIGQPRVGYAEVNWGKIESWHPNPGPFYDVGPLFDVAVYPLTLLTAWFGPVTRVTAGGGILYKDRLTREGKPFTVNSPDWAAAVVEFSSGFTARVTASFYVGWTSTQSGLEIHGDRGTIRMDRWDVFDSPVYLASEETGKQPWRLVTEDPPAHGIEFARGLSDLALAIREDRPHKTRGAHAAHVVDIVEAILQSLRSGQAVELPILPELSFLPATP